jgi:RimJ/RimL family protein N-acetyltransferase
VELRDISMDDLPLYEGMATDPAMMSELGGPLPREGLADKLREIVASVEDGSVWYLTIVPDPADGVAAGTVCVWEHVVDGEPLSEIGWMVLPSFQGRGLASEAVRSIVERARAEDRWGVLHAFPATTNGPSNAICRKAGFTNLGASDLDYVGRILRCNHWRLDFHSTDPA